MRLAMSKEWPKAPTTAWTPALDRLQGAAQRLAKVVEETSGGRFRIEARGDRGPHAQGAAPSGRRLQHRRFKSGGLIAPVWTGSSGAGVKLGQIVPSATSLAIS